MESVSPKRPNGLAPLEEPDSSADPTGIYLRLSKEESLKKGYSPETMVTACRQKCAEDGLRVVACIVEDGKGDDWTLPGLHRLFELVETRQIRSVVSFDTSRVSRDMYRRLWIKEELKQHGVPLLYATQTFEDSPEGEALENMHGVFDQYERAKIRMRTGMNIQTKLDREEVVGNGRTPWGLKRVISEKGRVVGYRPTDHGRTLLGRIVREVRTLPLSKVCERLEADGIRTPSGGRSWQPGTIWALLNNAVYVGDYRWGAVKTKRNNGKVIREKRAPDEVTSWAIEATISPAELATARAAMTARWHNAGARTPDEEDPYTLRGRLRCAHCGGRLSCTSNGYRTYTCGRRYPTKAMRRAHPERTRCPFRQVAAAPLERYAWRLLEEQFADLGAVRARLEQLSDQNAAVRRHRSAVESIETKIARLELRIQAVSEDIYDPAAGEETKRYAREQRADAERTLKEARESLARLVAQAPEVLTPERVDRIMVRLLEVKAGLEAARGDPALQRALYADLKVTATMSMADGSDTEDGEPRQRWEPTEDGAVKLGWAHWYAIAWEGYLGELSNGFKDPEGILIRWHTPADQEQPSQPALSFAFAG